MTVKKSVALFILSAILVCCESTFVDTLPKCRAWDHECQRKLMESFIHNIGSTGIQELDSARIDPLDIKGFNTHIFDLVDITTIEGNVKGIKDCTVSKFIINYDLGQISSDALCNIEVKNKFRASSYNPFIKVFLGRESLHGEGLGHATIEKVKISTEYRFELLRRNNDLYINSDIGNANTTFDVLGKVTFHADTCIGNDQSSEIIVRVLNENWRLVIDIILRALKDVSTGYINDVTTKLFNNLPLKYFINDFSPHIYYG